MIIPEVEIDKQITALLEHYPKLIVSRHDDEEIEIKGDIDVFRTVHDFSVRKTYTICIGIPVDSDELPYVSETSGKVSPDYVHRYSDGKLCVETEATIRMRFIEGFNLLDWVQEYVETYFVSYEYFSLYGQYPNGERGHGMQGVIETYRDWFHTKDIAETVTAMKFIRDGQYRGHLPCFCGCGKYLRKCHGKWVLPFFNDKRKRVIVEKDLRALEEEINEYRRNQEKTKRT